MNTDAIRKVPIDVQLIRDARTYIRANTGIAIGSEIEQDVLDSKLSALLEQGSMVPDASIAGTAIWSALNELEHEYLEDRMKPNIVNEARAELAARTKRITALEAENKQLRETWDRMLKGDSTTEEEKGIFRSIFGPTNDELRIVALEQQIAAMNKLCALQMLTLFNVKQLSDMDMFVSPNGTLVGRLAQIHEQAVAIEDHQQAALTPPTGKVPTDWERYIALGKAASRACDVMSEVLEHALSRDDGHWAEMKAAKEGILTALLKEDHDQERNPCAVE